MQCWKKQEKSRCVFNFQSQTTGKCIAESIPYNSENDNLLESLEKPSMARVELFHRCSSKCLACGYRKQYFTAKLLYQIEEWKLDRFAKKVQEQCRCDEDASEVANDRVAQSGCN